MYATYSFQKSTLNCEVMLEFQKLETLMHIVEDEIVMVPVQVKGRLVEEGVVLPHKLTTYKEYYYVRARSTYNCTTAHSTWCIVLPQIISTVRKPICTEMRILMQP